MLSPALLQHFCDTSAALARRLPPDPCGLHALLPRWKLRHFLWPVGLLGFTGEGCECSDISSFGLLLFPGSKDLDSDLMQPSRGQRGNELLPKNAPCVVRARGLRAELKQKAAALVSALLARGHSILPGKSDPPSCQCLNTEFTFLLCTWRSERMFWRTPKAAPYLSDEVDVCEEDV